MKKSETFKKLQRIKEEKGTGFVLLLDPEKLPPESIESTVHRAIENGVDVFFVGGSLLFGEHFDQTIQFVKAAAGNHPVVIFPGSLQQLSPHADALLFLSLISGRNPEHLIGSQVIAAPIVRQMQLEAISCGYMLIESGKITSAEFISNSKPIPRDKPGIALAHVLAAEYLGLQSVYLEAGSGAQQSVPKEMIHLVSKHTDVMLFAGGGIRTAEAAAEKAAAGADFVVVGNFFEAEEHRNKIREFADAIHRVK
ncbi:MAG: geranylgeranylglyceryl/heptaprenylglyceryl phosphate synthase [Calditrichia bacterium]